jgi:type II secretory pathway component PulF
MLFPAYLCDSQNNRHIHRQQGHPAVSDRCPAGCQQALRKGWWLLALLVAAWCLVYSRLLKNPIFWLPVSRWLLTAADWPPAADPAPVTLCYILALLLGSGVPLLRSLEISGDVVVNRAYQVSNC